MSRLTTPLLAALIATTAGCGLARHKNVEATCQRYCEQVATCDGDVDVESCTADCLDNVGDCQVDEQEQALDDLDDCAQESCDELFACTVGAQLQCTFGI